MDEVALEKISLGQNNYPNRLSRCLAKQAPQQITVLGNFMPLQATSKTVALVCSAKAPASILLAVHDLAQQWRYGSHTIISGFHSPVEQEAFEILLRGPGQVIYCSARSLPKRIKPAWHTALDNGRLTILSPFPDSVRRVTKETAVLRNRVISALADEILIAYAHPNSSTEQLAKEALGWGKSVYTLPNEQNTHLQQQDVYIYKGNFQV